MLLIRHKDLAVRTLGHFDIGVQWVPGSKDSFPTACFGGVHF